MNTAEQVLNIIIRSLPILIVVIVYFTRLEIRLAKITTDLKWLKEKVNICQQILDNDTP